MRKWVLTAAFVAGALPQIAHAGGSAELVTFGTENAGVSSSAFDYRSPPKVVSSSLGTDHTFISSTLQYGNVGRELHIVINNRCSSTNLGGGFSYSFANGVECASFAAPVPGRPAKKGKKPRVPSPEQIALALADRAIALAPDPQLEVTPGRIGLAGLESYFWIANPPHPIRATAVAGPVTVTAEARPTQYVWDFDDGSDHVSYNPGRRWTKWREGNIGHMYEASGRYDLAVDVVWEARWRIGAGSWQHLGYFSTSDSRPYPVREVIAMLVRPGWRPR